MKTIFTLVASLFMSIAVFAAAKPTSVLTIKSADNGDIRVMLDGKRYEPNGNAVMISNLDEGAHAVKVYKQRNNGVFNMAGKKYDLVYNAQINLKRRTNMFLTVERNGRISIMENKLKNDRNNGNSGNGRDDQWGDYDQHNGYSSGMSNSEFSRVLQTIDKEWFEGNKLKSATQVVKSNQVSASQVKQLVQLFSFENNKLELAKAAYANTVDKDNYDIIFDAFTYSASRTELQRFIRTGR